MRIDTIDKETDNQNGLFKTDEYQIKYWGYSRSVNELLFMYDNDEIVVPDLQREYVWNHEQASLFIDSLLRGLPIPSLFLTEIGNKFVLIDGLQRLYTLSMFINNKKYHTWKGKTDHFQLKNISEIGEKWRGQTFEELYDGYKQKLMRSMLHIIEFTQLSPVKNYSSMYQVFERINSTGKILSPQEVRNAAYFSEFKDYLNNLINEEGWQDIFEGYDERANDVQLILRFLSLFELFRMYTRGSFDTKSIPLKRTLNEYMAIYQAMDLGLNVSEDKFPIFYRSFRGAAKSDKIENDCDVFKRTISWISSNVGKNVFKNIKIEHDEYKYVNRTHSNIFEAIMIAVAYAIKEEKSFLNIENWEQARVATLRSVDFREYFGVNTMNTKNFVRRVNLFLEMFTGERIETQE